MAGSYKVITATVVVCIITVLLAIVAHGTEKFKGHPIAANNQVIDGIIPKSKIQLQPNVKKESHEKTEKLLGFFRSPAQQFMPLGFYAMVDKMDDVKILKQLQKNGLNLVHKYNSRQTTAEALKDLQAAKEAGIGVLQNLPRAHLKTKGSIFWRQHISTIAPSRQILTWYLPEERSLEELPYFKQVANIIKSVDKYDRPMITYVHKTNSNYLNQYGHAVDALVFGAYPSLYSPRPRIDIRRRIDIAYQNKVPVIIAALEAIHDGKMGPTLPEYIKCDAYLALISGAKGIMWYCYNRAQHRPEVMEAVSKVATELNGPEKLGEVLLSEETTTDIKCRLIAGSPYAPPASAYENKSTKIKRIYSSIQWTARKHNGNLYIFAVNVNEEIRAPNNGGAKCSVTVSFESSEFSGEEVEVLFENKTIPILDGKFSDNIEPLEVHIYRIPSG